MAADTYIFKRVEKKYLLTVAQYEALFLRIEPYLIPDVHGKSTICSLYLDTPDYRLIRASIDAKTYKEKLRLRSYGTPRDDSKVFLEIKKKFKGVVYKRRVSMTLSESMDYIQNGIKPFDSQIMREMDYAMKIYEKPQPAALIAYEREAYYDKERPWVRVTFDTGVRYRLREPSAKYGSEGTEIVGRDYVLMEIKTDGGMPLWLSAALDVCRIYPTSFSKYGTAYREFALGVESPYKTNTTSKGEKIHV